MFRAEREPGLLSLRRKKKENSEKATRKTKINIRKPRTHAALSPRRAICHITLDEQHYKKLNEYDKKKITPLPYAAPSWRKWVK